MIRRVALALVLLATVAPLTTPPPSAAAPAETVRTVAMRVASDEAYRAQPGWEASLRRTVQTVSDVWEREFRIRFEIASIVPWTSGEALSPARLLTKLAAEVPPGEEILVGFSHQRCVELMRGWAEPFGRRAVVMTGCPAGSLEVVSAEQGLSHELAHLFGVFHPPAGVRSVMRGYAHDVFDSQTIRVIRLMRGYDFRRGVMGLDEPTRRQWSAIWAEGHVPDEPNGLAKAVHNVGMQALQDGKVAEAIPRFQEAIAVDKTYATPHAMLGIVLSRQGRLDEAAAELRAAKALDFRQVEARTELGFVLARQGKMEDAVWEFREALAVDRRLTRARIGLGVALARTGKLDDAIRELRQVTTDEPRIAGVRVELAITLFRAEKYREAWDEVAQARALGAAVPPDFLTALREKMPEPAR